MTYEELDHRIAQRTGRRGAPELRHALELSDAGAESPAETLARLVLRPHFPGLRTQVVLRDAQGRPVARFDLADEELRLAFEADGRRGHEGSQMVAHDRWRDTQAFVLAGIWTDRTTWWELRCRPGRLVQRALTMLRARQAEAA